MLKANEYQLKNGRVITKPTKSYLLVDDAIEDLPNMSRDDVEFYADYLGWYSEKKMYGFHAKTGELTTRLATAARAELAKRKR
jgi:hypothetical protein